MYKKNLSKKQRKLLKTLALTRKILLFLGEIIGQEIEKGFDQQRFQSAWLSGGSAFVSEIKRSKREAAIRGAIAALKRRKFLEERRKNSKVEWVLTDKGKLAVLREQLRFADCFSEKEKCLVAFDVPEQERFARQLFRRFLKDCGFEKIQKSLWATDKRVDKHLLQFVKEMGIQEWVQVFVVKESEWR